MIKRGETVKALCFYDLFGVNIEGSNGIFIKKDHTTGKCLIYFPEVKEWAELLENDIKRISPGRVPKKNKAFIELVKTLGEPSS